jgi:hypothetical protein
VVQILLCTKSKTETNIETTDLIVLLIEIPGRIILMAVNQVIKKQEIRSVIIFMFLLFTIIIPTVAAFGHGGKHSEAFTHLQALQKATQLYDQLINNRKLDQSWETDLEQVTVSNRQKDDKNEIVVVFHRRESDPRAVYIFFNADGKYVGSNFTGE